MVWTLDRVGLVETLRGRDGRRKVLIEAEASIDTTKPGQKALSRGNVR